MMDNQFYQTGNDFNFSSDLYVRHQKAGTGMIGYPTLSCTFRDGEFTVEVYVPGLRKEDVEIELRDMTLCLRSDNPASLFSRCIRLPQDISPENYRSSIHNGYLKLVFQAGRSS